MPAKMPQGASKTRKKLKTTTQKTKPTQHKGFFSKLLIILEGSIGVGKTTVGRLVARELNAVFVDWDLCIAEAVGKPPGEPFRAEDQWLEHKKGPSGILHTKVRTGLLDNGTVVAAVPDSEKAKYLSYFEEKSLFHTIKIPEAQLFGFGLNAPLSILQERARLRRQNWDDGRPEPENFSLMPAEDHSGFYFGVGKLHQALDARKPVQELVDHILKIVRNPEFADPKWALRDTLGVPEVIYRPWLEPRR